MKKYEEKIKTYELINTEGCLFKTINTTSFALARREFNREFEGRYIILDSTNNERKNVILR